MMMGLSCGNSYEEKPSFSAEVPGTAALKRYILIYATSFSDYQHQQLASLMTLSVEVEIDEDGQPRYP